jgi:DNA (cytosine-5)-methyltransferase 1
MKYEYKLGELFCGPGGLSFGAISAKLKTNKDNYSIKHTWASDYDEDTCKTFEKNIGKGSGLVICEDIRRLDILSLPKIDIFAYGFPCNDFSNVGEKRGINGTFGSLYSYGLKVLDHFKPMAFVAENVKGLASADNGKTFIKILEDLAGAGNGYNITAHLYKFEEYGIPQIRHRIIIVGFDKNTDLFFKVPAPIHTEKYISSKEAIENPPIDKSAFNNDKTQQSQIVVKRLKYIKPGENVWNAKLPANLMLNVKKAKLSQIYRRLHPAKPAYTLTGSGGGGTHMYHYKEPRALTNRERARLQTFPDDFIFEGSKESVRKQIGMAVSPLMAKIIFESVLKTVAGISYNSIPVDQREIVYEPCPA